MRSSTARTVAACWSVEMALDDEERRELETLRAERAIHRVILRYARGVDSLDFERVRSCFHPDAQVRWGDWYEGNRDESVAWLSERIPALRGGRGKGYFASTGDRT